MALFDEFADAFNKADKLILAEIYVAREKNIYKISSAQLAEKIRETHPGKEVLFMEDFREIADYISEKVSAFISFARQHIEYTFLVTPIACGIAGFSPQQIAPLFREALAMNNVVLPKSFSITVIRFCICRQTNYLNLFLPNSS